MKHLIPPLLAILLILLSSCSVQGTQTGLPLPESPSPTQPFVQAESPTATITISPTSTPELHIQTPSPAPTASPTPVPGSVYFPAGSVSVPILLYHNISDRGSNRYITTVKQFRVEMETLHQEGYRTITISQLAEVIRNGGYLPARPIVLTFDDGYLGVYENAYPILEEYGYFGVVYIITSTLNSSISYGYMQKKEISELASAGWEIGSHSISHSDLKTSKLGLQNEMVQSREILENLLGINIHSFAYPYAIANAWIRERAEEYGYESAVGIDVLMTHSAKSLYYLSRREVPRSIGLADFTKLLEPIEYEIAAFPLVTPTPE